MTAKELSDMITKLSLRIVNARNSLLPEQRTEEWTKIALIVPLLEALGWDSGTDIIYESSVDDAEGRLDLILKSPVAIGVEAKALDVIPPKNRDHAQIIKGLKQSKDRGASYFIWTNGNRWQFFSLSSLNAPCYEATVSPIDEEVSHEEIADKFLIIKKERFRSNPKIIDEAIHTNWKRTALPEAWETLLENHIDDLIKLAQKCLPSEVEIDDDEISEFFTKLELPEVPGYRGINGGKRPKITHSFPDDWENLLYLDEPHYEKARNRFNNERNVRLGKYLIGIGQEYKPWHKKYTWRLVGLSDDQDERKKSGPVVTHFKDWGFIKQQEGKADMYERVEDSVPYLQKLFGEAK